MHYQILIREAIDVVLGWELPDAALGSAALTQAERDSAEQDYQARKDDSAVRQRPLGGDTDYERDSEPPRP